MDKYMPALQAILPEKQGYCFFTAFKLKSAAVGNN